ncbi:MAG: hypothetical protein HGA87_01300 [Desulfobulbaceae bacterium]|nr:hypothetical protein [Desulfobulbaceae bacterium]
MTQEKEVTLVTKQQQALERENVTEKVLREMEKRGFGLTIKGVDDKEGYKLVRDTRIECKKLRSLTVQICKKGREAAIQEQKNWIAAEKAIVARIEAVEIPLQYQESRIDALIEEAKRAKEQEIIDRTRSRVRAFADVGMVVDYVDALEMSDQEYLDTLESATAEYQVKQEEARIEAERLAAEQAERDRLAVIEAERLAREQEELRKAQAELEEARRKVQAEQEAVRRESERIEAEKRKAIEIAEAEKRAAERAKAEAEAEAKRKEDARIAAEVAEQRRIADEKAAADLKAAQAPDKEKLAALAKVISAITMPEVKTEAGYKITDTVTLHLGKVVSYIETETAKL